MAGRGGSHAFPALAQLQAFADGLLRGAEGDENRAHRVAPVIRIRPGHAGDGQGQVAAAKPLRSLGHGLGHRLGNGAPTLQKRLGHAQNPGLDLIAVGDHAALEDGGGAGQIG